jgi:hypothetical protein
MVITQYAEPVSISRANLPAYPHPSNGNAAAREGVLHSENTSTKLASILQKRGGNSEGRHQRQHRENGVSVFEDQRVDDYAPFPSQLCVDDCVRQIAQGIRHTSLVTRHTSHVTRHTSHITRHTPHVTHHTPQSGRLSVKHTLVFDSGAEEVFKCSGRAGGGFRRIRFCA